MTINYQQLAQELYEVLKEANKYIVNYDANVKVLNTLRRYKEEITRGTGRTTTLYIKSIAEALANPGKSVEFVDHSSHTWESARCHQEKLEDIINKLGYDVVVQIKEQAQVYLYNRFGH